MKLSELIKEIEEIEIAPESFESLAQTTKSGLNVIRGKTEFVGTLREFEMDYLAIQTEEFDAMLIVREDGIKEAIYRERDYLSKNGFVDDLVDLEDEESPERVEPCTNHDTVNNPSHYKRGEIDCIEALKASMSKEQFLGHLKATAIAYLWRYDLKNGLEDVKKAKWYIDRMIKELEFNQR